MMRSNFARIVTGDNVEVMRREIPDGSVQLTVTSPPYDNLRKYNGFTWDFEAVARELYRVTKPGGVVVWVVADATVNGSETGTSFRQALYFRDVCGFNLHDTMIYKSDKPPLNCRRYQHCFEYMFVFSRGPVTVFNALTEPSRKAGQKRTHIVYYNVDGTKKRQTCEEGQAVKPTKTRDNIWTFATGNNGDDKVAHPARYPELLAQDHILSWSNPGDTVLDPFVGSGTTGKMAILNGRDFIGIDISPEYCELARKRIDGEKNVGLFSEIGQL